MVFLMFPSSIGFSMDVHFCGNDLKSFSFFGEAEACEMMHLEKELKHACCQAPKKEVNPCHHSEINEGNCCQNQTLIIGNTGELEKPSYSVKHFQQLLEVNIVVFPKSNFFLSLTSKNIYTFYSPPLLITDISVLHQVFRI